MEINKQLFENVLSGKLKGTFVFRNQFTCNSDELTRNAIDKLKFMYPYSIRGWSYTSSGICYVWWDSNIDIVDFIPDTDMKESELTIEIPDNKVVDWDESKKQNKIVLKDKQLTYEEICEKLFSKLSTYYFVNNHGSINSASSICNSYISNPNSASTAHQLECILAKNKLATVTKYLNDGWKPKSGDIVNGFALEGEQPNIVFSLYSWNTDKYYLPQFAFKSFELAQKAIEILGEETVKLALEPLGI